MQAKPEQDRNQEATVYLGNLDERVTDALIWELMLQAGPVSNVHLPKDRISMAHQGFGFCEFLSEEDADYAVKIMNQIKLFGKPIRVNKASYDKKQIDIGANLFIGNLDTTVDEQALYDTFSTFGAIAEHPKIARDPSTGESKGYGFVSFHEFEAADMAIENMNGQFLGGKQVSVQYAFKKDGKGERHGTQAERLLAGQAKKRSLGIGGAFGAAAYSGVPPVSPAVPTPVSAVPPVPVAPVPVAGVAGVAGVPGVPPPMPAGFAPSNVIVPPPPPGVPVYPGHGAQPGYPPAPPAGYPAYPAYPGYDYGNGYGAPAPQQHQQAPPPPPPIRMGFNK